jgi:hypothetical protein
MRYLPRVGGLPMLPVVGLQQGVISMAAIVDVTDLWYLSSRRSRTTAHPTVCR